MWGRPGRLGLEIVCLPFIEPSRYVVLIVEMLICSVGGIISTYSFLEQDAPLYRNGYIISVSFLAFSAAMAIVYLGAVMWDNHRRDNMAVDSGVAAEIEEDAGDMAPTYRYNY